MWMMNFQSRFGSECLLGDIENLDFVICEGVSLGDGD